MKDSPLRLAVCIDDSASVLREVVLAPPGEVPSRSGTFTVNRKSAELIQAAIDAHGADVVIDWEHQTLGGEYAAPDGRAPATGWIKSVSFDEKRGIVASVAWNDRGTEAIRGQEYKYISPVFNLEDGKVIGLHSAGLVNKPAIPRMDALAASNRFLTKETVAMQDPSSGQVPADATSAPDPMLSLGVIAEKLGIKVESMDLAVALKQVADAIPSKKEGDKKEEDGGGKKDASDAVANSVRKALGLKDGAAEDEMLVVINSLRANDVAMKKAVEEIDALKRKGAERDADELMRPFLVANKINPSDAEDVKVCKELAMSDPAAFKHHMERRTPYAPPGKTTAPPPVTGDKKDRKSLIVNGARFFDENEEGMRAMDKTTFIDGELIAAGHKAMTEEEAASLTG